jgi:hypothetical protein
VVVVELEQMGLMVYRAALAVEVVDQVAHQQADQGVVIQDLPNKVIQVAAVAAKYQLRQTIDQVVAVAQELPVPQA